jgi:uncharacterized protein (TIGR03083 family)
VEISAHIEALRAEGERMSAAVGAADPDTPVPTCPEWTVRDMARHTGGVHRWATGYVRSGRTEPSQADLDEVVGTWPADSDLAAWLGRGCTDLVAALSSAPDDLQCWTFLPAPSPRAMWARRQAHETAIHRVDAELSAGAAVTAFDPPFAADGVDELLQLFVPRRSTGLRADPPTSLGLRCTDVEAAWLLDLGAEGVRTSATSSGADSAAAACTVSGSAGDLYLALWNRADARHLGVEGDRRVLDQFSEGVRITWA